MRVSMPNRRVAIFNLRNGFSHDFIKDIAKNFWEDAPGVLGYIDGDKQLIICESETEGQNEK